MVLNIADPNPANHTHERLKASGGKSNAIPALKCVAPPQISHTIVPTTPIHSKTEILPMVAIRRYSRMTIKMTSPPEMAFASSGVKACRYPAYFAKPIRSEERRVGKGGRSWWAADEETKRRETNGRT